MTPELPAPHALVGRQVPINSGCRNKRGFGGGTQQVPGVPRVSIKGPENRLTWTQSFPASALWQQLAIREEMNGLASWWELEGILSQTDML